MFFYNSHACFYKSHVWYQPAPLKNTQHEHNEHLRLNMLRIILVNRILVAMGFAKTRIVPYLIR